MKTGDYTIVCFTARQSGSQLTPVEGSASAERVYIQNYVPAAQKLSIVDWETGKAVKKLNLAAGDVGYLAVQSSPSTPRFGVGELWRATSAISPSKARRRQTGALTESQPITPTFTSPTAFTATTSAMNTTG